MKALEGQLIRGDLFRNDSEHTPICGASDLLQLIDQFTDFYLVPGSLIYTVSTIFFPLVYITKRFYLL